MLTGLFGEWPVPHFLHLSEDHQHKFWAETANDKESLKLAVEQHLISRSVETKMNAEGSEYLPLDVWEKRSFDPAKVRNGGRWRWHEVFGHTYSVGILSWNHEKRQEMVQEEMAKLHEKGKKNKTEQQQQQQ